MIKFIKKQHTKERLKRHEFYDGMNEYIYNELKNRINFELNPMNDWLRAGYQGSEITFNNEGQITRIFRMRSGQDLVKFSDGEIDIIRLL